MDDPSLLVSTTVATFYAARRCVLRYLALPRPGFLAVYPISRSPDPKTNLYNFERMILQPWYVKPTFWSKWGPTALQLLAFGGRSPGSQGDRFKPQGYDLPFVGPAPQEGKGIKEMQPDITKLMARDVGTCPFS